MAWKQGSNVAVGTHPQQTNVEDDTAELLGVGIGGLVGIGSDIIFWRQKMKLNSPLADCAVFV